MAFSLKLLSTVVLSALYCQVSGAPATRGFRLNTHRSHVVGRGLELHTYHPSSTFETFGSGVDHPLSRRGDTDIKESSISFVQSHLGVSPETISFKSGYSGEAAKHAYVKQTFNGIPVANAAASVAFNHDNKVVAFGSSFIKPKSIASSTPSISVQDATSTAEAALDGTYNSHPTSIQYIAKEDGTLILTHAMQIQNEAKGTWYEAFVDAHSGELVHLTDFVAKASYLVLPIQKQILTQGFETLTDPFDSFSSPLGWHSDGTTNYSTTTGNNVIAYKDTTPSALTGASSPILNFIYHQDPTIQPTVQVNVDAARTNAFYIANSVHDIMYRYGFTEAAFNFQTNNFGKGGKANDPVQVSVQSSAGLDNADFATPPDGQKPLMRMFLWDYVQPMRDGALENDIVVHENTHGMTNRMTGGGTADCLQTTESRGLGEGWSDAVAEWTEHNSSSVPDYVMGQYVSNWGPGVRGRPYSTSTTVNPLKYSSLNGRTEVHSIGEIWANLLHNVYASLVGKYGWSATARTDPTGSEGNVVFLHLLIDALALQPCNPTFVNARAAWIQADANRTRHYARGLKLDVYNPKSDFKTYNPRSNNKGSRLTSIECLTPRDPPDSERLHDSAVSFVSSQLSTNSTNVLYHKGWSTSLGSYAYMKQSINGVPVANSVANVAYDRCSQVAAFGSSFITVEGANIASPSPSIKFEDIRPSVEESLGGLCRDSVAPSLEYLVRAEGSVDLTYVVQITNKTSNLWVEAFVSAHSGQVLSVTDFTAHATFNVVPIQENNFFDGRKVLVDPEDLQSSPVGWISPPQEFNLSLELPGGNNVIMFADRSLAVGDTRVANSIEQSNSIGLFDNNYDPDDPRNIDGLEAVLDNAFFVMNTMHDISYRYGFTENASNFQLSNLGKGISEGEGDPVRVSVQDSSGTNNAQFQTPPEGSLPLAQFFFFDSNGVERDSSFANDVLIHEFTHGITNRMTGGGTARCLQSLEAAGMGEGWSDMMAAWVSQKSANVDDFRVGLYFDQKGIRSHPYSINEITNPLKFSDVAKLNEPHAIGEIWANTLYHVYADLVQDLGFSENAFTEVDGQEGNIVFMHNMIDGLLLQPCNPTMIQSRDAILAADMLRYRGAHQCVLWGAFARKGLGVDAGDTFEDGFAVPPECQTRLLNIATGFIAHIQSTRDITVIIALLSKIFRPIKHARTEKKGKCDKHWRAGPGLGQFDWLEMSELQPIIPARDESNPGALAVAAPSDPIEPPPITEQEVGEYREQDRFLPIANVSRIMKGAVPPTAKIAKDAKECVQECVSEFISFITSEAAEKCQMEKRKTIGGEDILYAMGTLGFENYAETLKIHLAKLRQYQNGGGNPGAGGSSRGQDDSREDE
ncbi:hypothetical protein NP233_g8473 [Leucocoprinus birnbaumii]|uniref:Extracellular metalloproteinase n=1 Tax=Leucocoprinus birnbaumii TaxID=56174 RepID=A0AAD5YN48_9AGAR|nr:hypothetical protein NP233_g8473 [Leucocoprinus birnbaumii]